MDNMSENITVEWLRVVFSIHGKFMDILVPTSSSIVREGFLDRQTTMEVVDP